MKLFEFLKSNGFTDEQIQQFGTLLHPVLTRFIEDTYAIAFTAKELEALEGEVLKNDLTEIEKDELLAIAYTNKTGRSIDLEVEEFLGRIVDEWEKHNKMAGKILMQIHNLPEEELKKEFHERMRMVEEKYFNDFKSKYKAISNE